MAVFDFDEFDSEEEETPEEEYEGGDEGQVSYDEAEDIMSEAERRFSLASYYKELINNPIFRNSDAEAVTVVKEVKQFARQRLEELIGLKAKVEQHVQNVKVESPFTDEQVEALKALADRLLQKPKLAEIEVKPKEESKPELQQVESRVKQPAPKPVAKAKPAPQPQRPQPRPTPKLTPKHQQKVAPKGSPKSIEDMPNGTPFKKGGKMYVWDVNDAGERYKRDISPKKISAVALPMPQGEALTMSLESLAQASVKRGSKIFNQKLRDASTNPDETDDG
jgi:outer membrane biosynthesis protein TonB